MVTTRTPATDTSDTSGTSDTGAASAIAGTAGSGVAGTCAAVLAVGRPTFDVAFGAARAAAARAVLERLGIETADIENADIETVLTDEQAIVEAIARVEAMAEVEMIIVLQATFTDASAVISLAAARDVPIVVWSFPEPREGRRLRLNSLCGANLAAYSLRRRRHRCAFVHIDPEHPDSAARVAAAVAAACTGSGELSVPVTELAGAGQPSADDAAGHAVAVGVAVEARLRGRRIGVIGAPPDGFEPCAADDASISSTFGVGVARLDLDDLFARSTAARQVDVDATQVRVRSTLRVDAEITPDDLEPSARLYRGMRDLVAASGLSAVATRCWPECMTEFGGAACTPHAMLTEDGVPGVCEADALGAMTALMLREVAGTDPFIADLVDLDDSDDTSVLWHCGVASTTLARSGDDCVGTVHPNRRVPLVNQFALRPGRVTVARLSQLAGSLHLVLGSGEMLDRARAYDGTSGTLHWDRPVAEVARTIFDLGVEHHLGVVYGDHRAVLVELARRWGIPVVALGGDVGEHAPGPKHDDGSLDSGAARAARSS